MQLSASYLRELTKGNERIRSDSSQLFVKMVLLFCPCSLCCSVGYQEQIWFMVESIKIKNNGQTRETRTDGFRKSNSAFEKKYCILSLGNRCSFS